ncbi:Bug family tripartite tricarboxylate transporter substrate binding protein [Aquamicrobium ahrensii]|uniref:Tripartite-type tricarboxylate transporter receptor subunit TctC n=1 Tax=Aquamicrobium ahrensii TaxID=469551 RepID=A0ABV2KP05_9HYPH
MKKPDILKKAGTWRLLAMPLAAVITAAAGEAMAQDNACDFFKGKTVELVVPFEPGGGFDIYGRMVAKFMSDELGVSHMIVRNQPGAGGLLATNQTWKSKPDGLRIQLMSTSGMITAEVGGAEGVGFKSGEFSWIGRVTGEPDIIATSPEGGVEGVDALARISAERKVRIGSSGVGDIDYVEAELLKIIFDLNSDIITGFSGAPEVYTSLARGELDLFTSSLSGAVVAVKAESGKPLWVFDTEGTDVMPDVKPLSEVIDPQFLPLVEAHSNVIAAGRALAAPPGVDEARLTCLRDAFDRTMAGEGLMEESRKLNRPVQPLTGAEIDEMISSVTEGAPQVYVDLLKQTYGQ